MKNKLNKFDALVDDLTKRFSRIENFDLFYEDSQGKTLFTFVVQRISEITSFKNLFINYFIPNASKSMVDNINELNNSKYKNFINISREELKENYYETIRLAYIGMFHKYENYVDDLIKHAEEMISDVKDSSISLPKYAEKNFNFRIKDWKNSYTIERLNWIAICNKHYDGYPRKEPVHPAYIGYSKDIKLKITKDEFALDMDYLISYYTSFMSLVFLLAMHKMSCEGIDYEGMKKFPVESDKDLIEAKQKADDLILLMIDKLKDF